jgi:glucose/arabinose dehydrogenase
VKFAASTPLRRRHGSSNTWTGPFQPFGKWGATQVSGSVKANSTILRFNPDGSGLQVYAWGLRNPFGVLWGLDGVLYVSEGGYEERGSRPIANAPDVIWQVKKGAWYGFPDFAAGVPVSDPEFEPGKGRSVEFVLAQHPLSIEQPLVKLPPHSGVRKIDFSRNNEFGFEGQMFVAEFGEMQGQPAHPPSGFQVVRIDSMTGETVPFFRARGNTLGAAGFEHVTTPGPKRPVDVRFSPEGDALYVVDFGAIVLDGSPAALPRAHPISGSGAIWRITRKFEGPGLPTFVLHQPATNAGPAVTTPSR